MLIERLLFGAQSLRITVQALTAFLVRFLYGPTQYEGITGIPYLEWLMHC